jgi:pimeloyl-ACP methyl ester carboxylesterase
MVAAVGVVQYLADCPCPIMYLRGVRDRIIGTKHVEMVRAVRSDVELVDLDAPHLALQADPERSWAIILSFASRCEQPSTAAKANPK